jgi:hypothetical protein
MKHLDINQIAADAKFKAYQNKPIFIAEVKLQSPFGYKSRMNWDEKFNLANTYGDWISIHTDPRWGGSFDDIREARYLTDKPILAKGLHRSDAEIEQALEMGATYVLTFDYTSLNYIEQSIVEPSSIAILEKIPPMYKVLWNSRDIASGRKKFETFPHAKGAFLGEWIGQASNLETFADIDYNASAVLVGEYLEEFARSWSQRHNCN